jgi:hypothetical protein
MEQAINSIYYADQAMPLGMIVVMGHAGMFIAFPSSPFFSPVRMCSALQDGSRTWEYKACEYE